MATGQRISAENSKNEKLKIEPNLNVAQMLETPDDQPGFRFAEPTHLNPMQNRSNLMRIYLQRNRESWKPFGGC